MNSKRATRLGVGAVASLLIGAMMSGCQQPTTPAKAPKTNQALAAALKAWAYFPVDESPRPIVLLEGDVEYPPGGAVESAVPLPTGPASADGYRIIDAQTALGLLDSTSRKADPAIYSSAHSTVWTVSLGERMVLTDRGPRTYPSWLFSFLGLPQPVAVVALPAKLVWPLPTSPKPGRPLLDGAVLGSDGRTVSVSFLGGRAGTGPCTSSYTLDVAESKTAVAVVVIAHPYPAPSDTACLSVGYERSATAKLAAPLGSRVLVDVSAQPVAVTSGG
jgi:hypothetical protein